MGKDKKARNDGRITVMALANLVAALVETMRDVDVPNMAIIDFLDRLERLNDLTLTGMPLDVMETIVVIVRGSVPVND